MIYYDAYNEEMRVNWINSEIGKDEISDLCYRRALSCFINTDDYANRERGALQYEFLKNWFGSASSKIGSILDTHKDKLIVDDAIVRKVLINLCAVYTNPVDRLIEDQKVLDLLDSIDVNDVIAKCHYLAKITGEVAVRPLSIDGKIMIQIFTPDNYRTKYKERKLVKLEYLVPVLEENIIAQTGQNYVITYETHVWTDEKFKIIDSNGNERSEDNRYGKIPFVILKLNDFNNYDFQERTGGAWNLISTQLRINMIDFIMQENEVFGSIGVWIFRNTEEIERDGSLEIGAGTYLRLEQYQPDMPPPDIEHLQAENIFGVLSEHKETLLKMIYKQYFLPSAITGDNKEMSGKAMELDRVELNEVRKIDKSILKKFDNALVKLIVEIGNSDGIFNLKDVEEYAIKYQDSGTIWDKKEQVEYLKVLKEYNYINEYDVLRELGYDGTDEELKELLIKNREINEQYTDGTNEQSNIQNEQLRIDGEADVVNDGISE